MQALRDIARAPHRNSNNVDRDSWRHPEETLGFFGVSSKSRVAELWPGSNGYYTEIFAPFLRDEGQYIAAIYDEVHEVSFDPQMYNRKWREILKSDPGLYNKVFVLPFSAKNCSLEPHRNLDAVLTFRNCHNFIIGDWFEDCLKAVREALRPGGIFGVVEHKSRSVDENNGRLEPEIIRKTGYVSETGLIRSIESSGFRLIERSDINANPADMTDHPKGVWSLPPWIEEKDPDYTRYLSIGESHRMTLRFTKVVEESTR